MVCGKIIDTYVAAGGYLGRKFGVEGDTFAPDNNILTFIDDTKIVEILDLTTLTWSTGPELPLSAYKSTSIVYKDALYVIGGRESSPAK